MKDSDVKARYDVNNVGVVGKAFHVSAGEETDKYLVSFRMNDFQVVSPDENDSEVRMVAMLSAFKHLFKPHFQLHDLAREDFNILCEVDKGFFRDEIQVTIDGEGKPIMFALDEREIDEQDPTKWVPKVKLSKDLQEEFDKNGE